MTKSFAHHTACNFGSWDLEPSLSDFQSWYFYCLPNLREFVLDLGAEVYLLHSVTSQNLQKQTEYRHRRKANRPECSPVWDVGSGSMGLHRMDFIAISRKNNVNATQSV